MFVWTETEQRMKETLMFLVQNSKVCKSYTVENRGHVLFLFFMIVPGGAK